MSRKGVLHQWRYQFVDISIVLLLNIISLRFIKSKHLMLFHQIYSVCGYVGIGLILDQTQDQRGLHLQILRITMKKRELHPCLSKVLKSQLRYADLNYIKIFNFSNGGILFETQDIKIFWIFRIQLILLVDKERLPQLKEKQLAAQDRATQYHPVAPMRSQKVEKRKKCKIEVCNNTKLGV